MRYRHLTLSAMALGAALLAAPAARCQASVGSPLPEFKFSSRWTTASACSRWRTCAASPR